MSKTEVLNVFLPELSFDFDRLSKLDCRIGQLTQLGVGVEKVHFPQNSQNLGDGKCLRKPRKSFVGLPSAKFFRQVLRDQVFQQPQAITRFDCCQ
jgi:hypothetical protein